MIIETENSEYLLEPMGSEGWMVTKVKTKNPDSTWMRDGLCRKTLSINIRIGQPAHFDTWYTSIVTSVRNKNGKK